MSRSCNAADVPEFFDSSACYSSSPELARPHPAIPNDVRVFSPYGQKCLVFKHVVIPLGAKLRVVLGSDAASCDLVLMGKPVDPQHAMVLYHNGGYFIQDLDSRCGTYVNGRRISSITELRVGDEIALRPYTIRFSVVPGKADPPGSTGDGRAGS
jgi:neural Wiskott-Aldrich syndrome protein